MNTACCCSNLPSIMDKCKEIDGAGLEGQTIFGNVSNWTFFLSLDLLKATSPETEHLRSIDYSTYLHFPKICSNSELDLKLFKSIQKCFGCELS